MYQAAHFLEYPLYAAIVANESDDAGADDRDYRDVVHFHDAAVAVEARADGYEDHVGRNGAKGNAHDDG